MKKLILIALLTGSAAFGLACSGDDNNNKDGGNDSGPADTGTDVKQTDGGTDSGIPTPPTLKAQVDRMGRPAINTALNHVFDTDAGAAGVAKDSYNADKNVAGWTAAYTPQFAGNLAVFDSLDTTTLPGDGCGNQAGFTIAHTYATLGGLAADDRLYVDTSQAACTQYLGVELKATGIAPNLNDCGGRKLSYDVIETTYSALAVGATTGVDDGITAPASKTGGTTFPYLSAPQ